MILSIPSIRLDLSGDANINTDNSLLIICGHKAVYTNYMLV